MDMWCLTMEAKKGRCFTSVILCKYDNGSPRENRKGRKRFIAHTIQGCCKHTATDAPDVLRAYPDVLPFEVSSTPQLHMWLIRTRARVAPKPWDPRGALGWHMLRDCPTPLQRPGPPVEQSTLAAGTHRHHVSLGAALKGKSSFALLYQGQSQKHWITNMARYKKAA